eukprot:1899520-Pleurochrysis_carterae.AAC.2
MAASSAAVHSLLFTSGLRWLCHRSRHCLPERPSICAPMDDQGTLPSTRCSVTSLCSFSSSLAFQICFFHVEGVPSGVPRSVPASESGLKSESSDAAPLRLAHVLVARGATRNASSDTSIVSEWGAAAVVAPDSAEGGTLAAAGAVHAAASPGRTLSVFSETSILREGTLGMLSAFWLSI